MKREGHARRAPGAAEAEVPATGRRAADACTRRRLLHLAGSASFALLARPAGAASEHEAHARSAAASGVHRSVVRYTVPDLQLVRDDGRPVSLRSELQPGRPVVMAFVYTSCTTVCPAITQTLAQLQDMLGPLRDTVGFLSISIDPEFDTPARLREYARRFGAGPQWHHYTGTVAASQAVQRAFGVYRGNKMEHQPATLLRVNPGDDWVRMDGFVSARELITELPDWCTGTKPRA